MQSNIVALFISLIIIASQNIILISLIEISLKHKCGSNGKMRLLCFFDEVDMMDMAGKAETSFIGQASVAEFMPRVGSSCDPAKTGHDSDCYFKIFGAEVDDLYCHMNDNTCQKKLESSAQQTGQVKTVQTTPTVGSSCDTTSDCRGGSEDLYCDVTSSPFSCQKTGGNPANLSAIGKHCTKNSDCVPSPVLNVAVLFCSNPGSQGQCRLRDPVTKNPCDPDQEKSCCWAADSPKIDPAQGCSSKGELRCDDSVITASIADFGSWEPHPICLLVSGMCSSDADCAGASGCAASNCCPPGQINKDNHCQDCMGQIVTACLQGDDTCTCPNGKPCKVCKYCDR